MVANNERSLQMDQPRLAVIKSIDLKLIPAARETEKPRRKARDRKEKNEDPFKDWCMPDQGSRYIKPNTYDFF